LWQHVITLLTLISGFRRDVDEICGLLGYYTASCGNYLPTFRDNPSNSLSFLAMGYFVSHFWQSDVQHCCKETEKFCDSLTFFLKHIENSWCCILTHSPLTALPLHPHTNSCQENWPHLYFCIC
jgi:hypothetical protein